MDADGTLWIAFDGFPIVELPGGLDPGPRDGPPVSGEGHGVLSFDGTTWRQYLVGQMVNRVAIAPDGSAWAASLFDCPDPSECVSGGGGLYVITPEAVAVAE